MKLSHHRLCVIPGCLTVLLLILWWISPVQAQSGITLNLKDADIRTLIETVSEATGKNFVIDPRIKAKVTVVSSQPMNQNEVYQVFLSILQVHGYSAVPVGEVIKIVPDVTAKQGPVDVTSPKSPGTGDQLVTRVLHVENVPAAQMVPILRPLVPQQGHLAAYAASNVLVVSDRAANVRRLEQIIRRIDIPDHQQIEIIPLQHASAYELVRIISSLTQKEGKGSQGPGKPVLAADDRSNSILLGGDKNSRLRIRGLIAHLDTPVDAGGNTQVVFLKYAQAEDLAAILQGVSSHKQKQSKTKGKTTSPGTGAAPTSAASSSSKRKDEIDIQADPLMNALIITAPPDQFKNIRSVIRQLDIRREQVLVEAVIAEVETSLAQELGVQFAVVPPENDSGPVALSNLGGAGKSLTDLLVDNAVQSIGAGLFLGAADLTEGATRFAFLLRALSSDTLSNILSTPTLVTMDNEEAEISVGQNVPFRTGSFTTSASEQSNPFQTIEREDVGVKLTLTPQINEGDTVKLEIEQEVSDVVPGASLVAADLITNKRVIKTSVLVEDDQILVLGGLIKDTFTDSVSKVPLLGDIPILGRLFRFDETTKKKTNLMVFIHPVILRDEATANIYTNRKYGHLRARQLEADIANRGLIEDTAARLPDLDDLMIKRPLDGKKDNANQDVDAFIELE